MIGHAMAEHAMAENVMTGAPLTRLADWEERLGIYLADRHGGSGFSYAHADYDRYDDCCSFTAGAVRAMTGVDPMAEFRGRYRTRIGALRALHRFGAGTLEATIDGKFGRIRPAFARRGDLVMVADVPGDGEASADGAGAGGRTARRRIGGTMGLCMGAEILLIGDQGLIRRPRADAVIAWAVGQ